MSAHGADPMWDPYHVPPFAYVGDPVSAPAFATVPIAPPKRDFRQPLIITAVASLFDTISSLFASARIFLVPALLALYAANTGVSYAIQSLSGSTDGADFLPVMPCFAFVFGFLLMQHEPVRRTVDPRVWFIGWLTWVVLTLVRWPVWRAYMLAGLATAVCAALTVVACVLVPLLIVDVYERCSASTLYDDEMDWTPPFVETIGWRIRDIEEALLAFWYGYSGPTFGAAFASRSAVRFPPHLIHGLS